MAARGHEIGLHGLRHVALGDVGPERTAGGAGRGARAARRCRPGAGPRLPRADLLADPDGRPGRSTTSPPAASPTPPACCRPVNPLHGWPGAPRTPFRWENGLLELPCPVAGAGRAMIPFLGGIYLRYVPLPLISRLLARLGPGRPRLELRRIPYDLDPDEPFFVLPHAGWLTSRILHTRRGATLPRLERVLAASGRRRAAAGASGSTASATRRFPSRPERPRWSSSDRSRPSGGRRGAAELRRAGVDRRWCTGCSLGLLDGALGLGPSGVTLALLALVASQLDWSQIGERAARRSCRSTSSSRSGWSCLRSGRRAPGAGTRCWSAPECRLGRRPPGPDLRRLDLLRLVPADHGRRRRDPRPAGQPPRPPTCAGSRSASSSTGPAASPG